MMIKCSMRIAKVVFFQAWSDEYDYYCDENVCVGDLVLAPVKSKLVQGMVCEIIDIIDTIRANAINPKIKEIKIVVRKSVFTSSNVIFARRVARFNFVKLGAVLKLMISTEILKQKQKIHVPAYFKYETEEKIWSVEEFIAKKHQKTLISGLNRKSIVAVNYLEHAELKNIEYLTQDQRDAVAELYKCSESIRDNDVKACETESLTDMCKNVENESQHRDANNKSTFANVQNETSNEKSLEISEIVKTKKILLEGATGSGKTEVYIEWITMLLQKARSRNVPHVTKSMIDTDHEKTVQKNHVYEMIGRPNENIGMTGDTVANASTTDLENERASAMHDNKTQMAIAQTNEQLADIRTPIQILILMPEVSLTFAFVERLCKHFGINPLIWNHKTSATGKQAIFDWATSDESGIVIGTRSAIFLPFKHLKCIIMDEEHDDSYKQSEGVRYHAKDCAEFMCDAYSVICVYVSATPSMDLLIDPKCKHVKLTRQPQHGQAAILISDMSKKQESNHAKVDQILKKELQSEKIEYSEIVEDDNNAYDSHDAEIVIKNDSTHGKKRQEDDKLQIEKQKNVRQKRTLISAETFEYIRDRMSKNELCLLFMNRKGFASVIMCYSCRVRMVCKSCSVGLVYYKNRSTQDAAKNVQNTQNQSSQEQARNDIVDQRESHDNRNIHATTDQNKTYGKQQSNVAQNQPNHVCGIGMCHYCGYSQNIYERCNCGNPWSFSGTGVEHIEALLLQEIPELKTRVVHSDIGKQELAEIMSAANNRELDVLIGTQMLIQGHNIEHLTFICILDCDLSLAMPYYNANERTYEIFTQARGRAGRGRFPGVCMLQTYNPKNKMIENFKNGNLDVWKKDVLTEREKYFWPPYCNLLSIILESHSNQYLQAYTRALHAKLLDMIRNQKLKITINHIAELTDEQKNTWCHVLGPTPSSVHKMKGQYRNRFLVKYKNFADAERLIELWIEKTKEVRVSIDNHPENFM